MLCLACGSAEPDNHAECAACGHFLGLPAEGRGYLPQLLRLQEGLLDGQLSADQAEAQLLRLDEALGLMIGQFDQFGQQILNLPLDDAQAGTVAGFLSPARESLAGLRAVAAELSLDGRWQPAQWDELKQYQQTLLQANQGIQFLRQQLMQLEQRTKP